MSAFHTRLDRTVHRRAALGRWRRVGSPETMESMAGRPFCTARDLFACGLRPALVLAPVRIFKGQIGCRKIICHEGRGWSMAKRTMLSRPPATAWV